LCQIQRRTGAVRRRKSMRGRIANGANGVLVPVELDIHLASLSITGKKISALEPASPLSRYCINIVIRFLVLIEQDRTRLLRFYFSSSLLLSSPHSRLDKSRDRVPHSIHLNSILSKPQAVAHALSFALYFRTHVSRPSPAKERRSSFSIPSLTLHLTARAPRPPKVHHTYISHSSYLSKKARYILIVNDFLTHASRCTFATYHVFLTSFVLFLSYLLLASFYPGFPFS
jgi:hypothetical protein